MRGKRCNVDPVPLDSTGYQLITRWITAYNAPLTEDDPRRIDDNTPIWQPLLHNGGHHPAVGTNGNFQRGISTQSISRIIRKRSADGCGREIAPHDCRRTVAALARQNGMGYDEIRQLLRHKSIATTAKYVGNPPDLAVSLLSNHMHFAIA